MRLRRILLALPIACLSLAMAVVAVAGCGASGGNGAERIPTATAIVATITMSSSPSPGDPTGATWTLTGMLVDGVTWSGAVPGGRAITLQFRPDLSQLIGNAGCNSYDANYTLSGDALHVIAVEQTQIGCSPPVVTEENTYLAALLRVERFAVSAGGDTLTLSSNDGQVHLTYRRS